MTQTAAPKPPADLPKRVLIIGSAGSGKSTAARLIGAALDLPVYHMDREVFWLPGWVERGKADQVAQVKRIVAKPGWVFEGNNSSTFAIREARADLLIWLDLPLPLRLWRVIRRNIRGRGASRPDMAEGCDERLSMLPGFLWFILRTARGSRRKQSKFYAGTRLPKHHFRNSIEVDQFVESLA
ncbi:AAA family ATPase [Cognatishimia sp.]|uniref:AAA family ATPase n=1 Tax=Cognatishimia sp. TaxID=2211648 RepID=UPI003510EFD9